MLEAGLLQKAIFTVLPTVFESPVIETVAAFGLLLVGPKCLYQLLPLYVGLKTYMIAEKGLLPLLPEITGFAVQFPLYWHQKILVLWLVLLYEASVVQVCPPVVVMVKFPPVLLYSP